LKKRKKKEISQGKEENEEDLKDIEKKLNENFDWDFIFDREWSRIKK
jgi:hypothetical protein